MAPITVTPVLGSGNGGVQREYPLAIGEGRLGLIYDMSYYTSRSFVNGRGDVIAFGMPLSYHATEDRVTTFSPSLNFAGIAAISDTFVPGTLTAPVNAVSQSLPGYPDKYVVNVIQSGAIWVFAEDAVQQGDAAAVITGAGIVPVAFTVSGTTDATDIPGKFLRDAAAGELVPLQLTF